ncbi:hypothetical protein [Halobacillus litoralis]|uniref:hypothetical protein n=1 Tax=Halobacillus litoralis TaxID=45668 RepID=UPI001CD5AA7F|nr:hypothetical protein [Halobacillus litoralis]MCA1021635.1 hypothetical protein [Halobacillus litoralis]
MTVSEKKVDFDKHKQCLRCLKWLNIKTQFYISYNKWHSDGKLPYCKKCLKDNLDEDNYISIIETLRVVDKPYFPEVWSKAKADKKDTLGKYFTMINFNNHKYDTYADSIFDTENKQVFRDNAEEAREQKGFTPDDIEDVEFTKEEMEYLLDFWGKGYETYEYEFLQKEFEKFTSAYEADSPAMEILFQEASHMRLTIKRKRENNESVDKELKTLQDLLGSANIKPNQETGANASEQASFGVLLKKYENERPTPDPDPEWEDVDGIKKYFNVWFLGHLCKMMGIQNEYAHKYEEEINKYTVEPPEQDPNESDEA